MTEQNSSDDLGIEKSSTSLNTPAIQIDNVEEILNNTERELQRVKAGLESYFKISEKYSPESQRDEPNTSNDGGRKNSTAQQAKITTEVKKALSFKTVDKNKAVKGKVEVTGTKTKEIFRYVKGGPSNRRNGGAIKSKRKTVEETKSIQSDDISEGEKLENDNISVASIHNIREKPTRKDNEKTKSTESDIHRRDDISEDGKAENDIPVAGISNVKKKPTGKTKDADDISREKIGTNFLVTNNENVHIKETESRCVQTEDLSNDKNNTDLTKPEYPANKTVSVATSPIKVEPANSDIEVGLFEKPPEKPKEIDRNIEITNGVTPDLLPKLTIQKLPGVDIRGPLVKQKLPNVVIAPEESVANMHKPQNIKYLEIKETDSKISAGVSSEVEILDTIPEELDVVEINDEDDQEAGKENVAGEHSEENRNLTGVENAETQTLNEGVKDKKTISEELSIDISSIPTVRTLQEIQNYLENRVASIKDNIKQQREMTSGDIAAKRSTYQQGRFEPKRRVVSANKEGEPIRLDNTIASKLTEKYESLFGTSFASLGGNRNDDKVDVATTSKVAEENYSPLDELLQRRVSYTSQQKPEPSVPVRNNNSDISTITQFQNRNLSTRLSSLRTVLDKYNFPNDKTFQNEQRNSESPLTQKAPLKDLEHNEILNEVEPQNDCKKTGNILFCVNENIPLTESLKKYVQTNCDCLLNKEERCTGKQFEEKASEVKKTDSLKTKETQTNDVNLNSSLDNIKTPEMLAEKTTQTNSCEFKVQNDSDNDKKTILKSEFPWHRKLSSTPYPSPKNQNEIIAPSSPISSITSGEKLLKKIVKTGSPKEREKDKETKNGSSQYSPDTTPEEADIECARRSKCKRDKTNKRIRKRCVYLPKKSKCALVSTSSSCTSEGEYKVQCKCNTSIGESHLCRYVNLVRSDVRFYKRNPAILLRKALNNDNVNITGNVRHYDNWVTYSLKRPKRKSNVRDVLNK